jgi:hypothetical protein
VKNETPLIDVRILIKMINTVRIQQRTPTLYSVDRIAFVQQQLSQIGTVLTGDSRNQSDFRQDAWRPWLGILMASEK